MMEVYYSADKRIIITDREFSEAVSAWNSGKSYWCRRIKSLLSPFHKVVEPIEFGFWYLGDDKVIKDGDKYLLVDDNGNIIKGFEKKGQECEFLTPDQYLDGKGDVTVV